MRRLAWPAGACAVLALLGLPGGAAWGQVEASRDAEAATIAPATSATPQASTPSRTPASSAAPRRHPAKLVHRRTASQPAAHPAVAPATMAAPRSPAPPADEAGDDLNPARAPKGYVITNEDLRRYARPGDAAPTTAAANAALEQKAFDQDSLKKVTDKPATDAYHAKLLADAQARIQAAVEKVDALKKQELADANPLVPPPANQTEEDKRREGMSRRALLAATQEQVKQAQAELAAARADLEKVKQQLAEAR